MRNNTWSGFFGFDPPVTARYLKMKAPAMPTLPSASEQAQVLATLMAEQRSAQEAMYQQRQDEVREQEEERIRSEEENRQRMARVEEEREAAIAEAERLAQLEAEEVVVEDVPEEEQLIFGFHGLYGDWESGEDEEEPS